MTREDIRRSEKKRVEKILEENRREKYLLNDRNKNMRKPWS